MTSFLRVPAAFSALSGKVRSSMIIAEKCSFTWFSDLCGILPSANKEVLTMSLRSKATTAFYCMLTLISPALNAKVIQRVENGHRLDLNRPVSFSDKLLALKIKDYNHNPLVSQCADKYAVRQYVRDCGCGEMLNELLAVYDSVDEINWNLLPQQFAMKWNFGSHFNLICPDKTKLDIADAARKMRIWGKTHFGLRYAELQYEQIKKKILVEKFLSPRFGVLPPDYKLYCFHGACMAILYIAERDQKKHKAAFFDPEWNYLGVPQQDRMPGRYAQFDVLPEKPQSMDKMIRAAEILSEPFPFVRVDFYDVDGRAIFGEMTFTPSAGHFPSEIEIHGKSMADLL